MQFNSSRQTLNLRALRLWTFQIKWMVGWLTQIIIITSSFYNQMSCLVSVKSLYHKRVNIISSWLMWLARKAMFTEGWKLQEVKITKRLQKENDWYSPVTQLLWGYSRHTVGWKIGFKHLLLFHFFILILGTKAISSSLLRHRTSCLRSVGQLYTGNSSCIWERVTTSSGTFCRSWAEMIYIW